MSDRKTPMNTREYRAWDIGKQIYHYLVGFTYEQNGRIYIYYIYKGEDIDNNYPIVSSSYWAHEIVLEQFTGLLDKNGIKIFEGDRFKGLHDYGSGGFKEQIAIVKYNIKEGYQWNYWDLDSIEVIGHIHEEE